MKKDNQTIKCSVEDCKYHIGNDCSLDKIKVASCESNNAEGTKERTMCDSYKSE